MAELPSDDCPLPSFRPAKRRKFHRKRDDEPGDEAPQEASTAPSPPVQSLDDLILSASASASANEPPPSTSVADLIRQRKALQRKRHGIEFSASRPLTSTSVVATVDRENGPREEKLRDWDQVGSRFAPQTGQAVSEDKHMMAYIDAHLSSRLDPTSTHLPKTFAESSLDTLSPEPDPPPFHSANATRQPASLGKLLEIDLSTSPTPPPNPAPAPRKPRTRLDRHGRPLPPRARPRRGSDALKRDAIVEDLLRENRIELYESPVSGSSATNGGAAGGAAGGASKTGASEIPPGAIQGYDLDADERMAAEFRAEFLEGLQRKRALMAPQVPGSGSGGAKGKEEEKLKGPKLGGSRSQRAVVRERELEAQRERERERKGRR